MSKEVWEDIFIKTAKTWCQAFLATIGGSAEFMEDVNWKLVFSASFLAAIICFVWNLLLALRNLNDGPDEMTDEEAQFAIENNESIRQDIIDQDAATWLKEYDEKLKEGNEDE